MKVLVIYAHPSNTGHCATILREVENNLKIRKANYEILDLYKLGFDPVLKESELYGRDAKLHEEALKYQEKIKNTNLLIFIYPIWWNTMPAILKGFFDRVFSSGFAFKYAPVIPSKMMPFFEKIFRIFSNRFDYGIPIGLLRDKKAIVFMTTGSPKVISYPLTGNRFIKIIKKDILGFFGIRSKIYHIGNCRKLNDYKIAEIVRTVGHALRRVK